MIFQNLIVVTLTWISSVRPFDNEDFFTLLCAADENNMDKIYEKCELVLKDAVDGCIEKCFIEVRNRRSPLTRIDDKYYQFVMCDQFIWREFIQCVAPCLNELKVSYNGYQNWFDWSNCMVDTVREMEETIEHQDDPKTKPNSGGSGEGGSKTRPGSNGKEGSKPKNVSKEKGGKGKGPKKSNRKDKPKQSSTKSTKKSKLKLNH